MSEERFQRQPMPSKYVDRVVVIHDTQRGIEFELIRTVDGNKTTAFWLHANPIGAPLPVQFRETWSYAETPNLFVYRWRMDEIISLIEDHPINEETNVTKN